MVLPNTLDQLTRTIHILQQLQRLLTISARLSDLGDLLAEIEAEYGSEIRLEDVIQHLEGQHLAFQVSQRKAARQASQGQRHEGQSAYALAGFCNHASQRGKPSSTITKGEIDDYVFTC